MKQTILLVLLLSVAINGFCIGGRKERKNMESWIGSKKHSLIVSWGPPSQTADDGDGGEILIYSNRVYVPAANYGGMYKPATDYYHNKMMYVHSDGKIYYWRISNTANPPSRVDVNLEVHHSTY
jgi:hypothetical protein